MNRTHSKRSMKIIAVIMALTLTVFAVPAFGFAQEAVNRILDEPIALTVNQTDVQASTSDTLSAQSSYSSLGVAYHTPDEIRAYIFNNDVNVYVPTEYDQLPSVTSPYSIGKVSDDTLNEALRLVNLYRYIAGIDDNVVLDSTYTEQCQTGALVNAANGVLDHYPTQPASMSAEMHNTGYQGCSHGNLACGMTFLQDAVMAWMDDTDASNIKELGHRRWFLNPKMGKTGFGAVGAGDTGPYGWYAMYSTDQSNTSASQTNIAWPAQNTPMHLFEDYQAWSLTTGEYFDATNVEVTVTRTSDQKTWHFSQSSSDGDFYIAGADQRFYSGLPGITVIFRPANIAINDGDSFTVQVQGVPTPVEYNVNFFTLYKTISSATLAQTSYDYDGTARKPTVTAKYGSQTLTEGQDYKVEYKNNVNAGTATAVVSGLGDFGGSIDLPFTINQVSLANVSIDSIANQPYTGYPVKPALTVTYGSRTLVADVDYTATYENNVSPGTATVRIDGKGNYSGTQSTSFVIDAPTSVPMHRLYNPFSGEHFYTADSTEKDGLVAVGWTYENYGWYAPLSGNPVYRLYNKFGGEHHYTLNAAEKNALVSAGWEDEGIGWYSDVNQTVPVYREYNPFAFSNNHNYTPDLKEHNLLVGIGWKDEGVAWYGV